MLILARRATQSIVFPNCGITVRILDINGRVAKVGIEAPRSVAIMRGELVTAGAASPLPSSSYEASDEVAPANEAEPSLIQFEQRLAELKSNLHIFQQLRAAGKEEAADQVLAELLSDLASLDNDWLASQQDGETSTRLSSDQFVSETRSNYEYYASKSPRPLYVLVIQPDGNSNAQCSAPMAIHGCQTYTVNSREAAEQAIRSQELFDIIIYHRDSNSFDEMELVRTIRNTSRFDGTKVFVTSSSIDRVEQLAMANQYGIDGWLELPLCPINLRNHIVESQQLDT